MVSFLVFCLLFWVSGAASGTQDPNSEQDPGTPSLLESCVMERGSGDALCAAVACAAFRLCRLCRDCPRLFATPPSAYAATRWRRGPVPYDVREALHPVLSALFVYMFACSVPRFQL